MTYTKIATDLVPVMPRQVVPPLDVALSDGGRYSLSEDSPKHFSMVVFYRGLHCQQCKAYLGELEKLLPEFDKRGITSVAVSMDEHDRAAVAKSEWGLEKLRIGYGLSLQSARDWGLFLTEGRPRAKGLSEPPFCCEPAVFLVGPDKTMWFSAVQNMAFARPRFEDIISGFEFLFGMGYFTEKECPARGEMLTLPQTVPA
jgi:peroxiredoxin